MIRFGKIPNEMLDHSMIWQIRPCDMCPTFCQNLFGSKFLIKPKEIINVSIIKVIKSNGDASDTVSISTALHSISRNGSAKP